MILAKGWCLKDREERPCNVQRYLIELHHAMIFHIDSDILPLCTAYQSQPLSQLPLSVLGHPYPNPSLPCVKPAINEFQSINQYNVKLIFYFPFLQPHQSLMNLRQ